MNASYDLVALGGGTGGLVSAAGAAYLGLDAAIVEKAALGGDCLWSGCVPTKALIASGRLAHRMRGARSLGLSPAAPAHDFRATMERMRAARAAVARHDDPERFRRMGVAVHFGAARFTGPETVEIEGVGTIRSKRFIVATGAAPVVPSIPGLRETGFLTYETVLDEDELPESIAILGAGPVGTEFAQIFARLGARVTVLETAPSILVHEDPDVGAHMQRLLAAEGIDVRTGTSVSAVRTQHGQKLLTTAAGDEVAAREIFVATGRRPFVEGLDLEAAGVRTRNGAVVVNPHLRTSARTVWAVGDVTGAMQFTHVADQMAKVALRNASLPVKAKIRYDCVPRVTFTDPEVAHVGMLERDAVAAGGTVYRYELDDLDRAIVDGTAAGFVKISADRRGRIMGATVVAHGGGELILPLVLAKQHGLTLGAIANTIFPYPTMAEGVKRASAEFLRSRLDTPAGRFLKKAVQWLK